MTGKDPARLEITDWIPGDRPRDRPLLGPEILNELPLEEETLAASHPEKTAELLRRLREWRDEVGAKMPRSNPDYDPGESRGVHADPEYPSVRKELEAEPERLRKHYRVSDEDPA